ncbi:DHHW family protein [Paraeggerthella hongkongensis]|uniref:DHHW family protein n=1 Tax=Paraeggerthella hongkongensis TaxID=230658 RepID=UPI0011CE90B0|nr:DHHW family protein [Paraeggerthella hongkongensis]
MLRKIQNVLFVSAIILVCCAVFGYKFLDKTDALPQVADNGTRSYLEGRSLMKLPLPSVESYLDASFQEDVESYCRDSFPAREKVMLANASIERSLIELSAKGFGYDLYPTFYGSEYCFSVLDKALFPVPSKQSDGRALELQDTARSYSAIAEACPEIRFVSFVPDRGFTSDANPLFDVVSNAEGRAYIDENYSKHLSGSVISCEDVYSDTEEYLEYFSVSDHHWNIKGAYRGYSSIARALGNDVLLQGECSSYYDCYGSYARGGLIVEVADTMMDMELPYPEYSVYVSGKVVEPNKREAYVDKELEEGKAKFDAYGQFFGSDIARKVYVNASRPEADNLLVIGDSFATPCVPMLASTYHKTFVLDPRKYKGTLSDFLAENSVKDVVLIVSTPTLTSKGMANFMN